MLKAGFISAGFVADFQRRSNVEQLSYDASTKIYFTAIL